MTLKELRQRQSLTQEALAELVGTSRRQVRRWENGEGQIPIGRLPLLAQALNADYNTLVLAIGELEALDAREIGSCKRNTAASR